MTIPRPALVLLARLRGSLRGELGLVVLAIVAGALAGVAVSAMTLIVNVAHVVIYGIPFDVRLSAAERVPPLAAFAAPMLAGLALGAIDLWRARRKLPPAVDPVEANALRGGRMSLTESLLVAMQTVVSNGCGASVGLEAGYAQIGGGVASRMGINGRLRRQDLRMLVGCGTGGAIAAAFGAPLTGAFYAFELIIGAYSLAIAAPVFAACARGRPDRQGDRRRALCDRGAGRRRRSPLAHHVALIGLGLVAAAVGVGAMRAAAVIERAFRCLVASRLPAAGCGRRPARRHGALHAAGARRRPRRARARFLLAAQRARARHPDRAEAVRQHRSRSPPAFAAACSSPRCSSARCSASSMRSRSSFAFPGLGLDTDRLRARRHGRAQHGHRRRPADHDLPRAREHRRSRHRRRGARGLDRGLARGAGRPSAIRSPPGACTCAARRSAAGRTWAGCAT